MDTYHVVLYLHLLSLFLVLGAASVELVCALQLHAARTHEDARPWIPLAERTAHAFPLATLGLLGTGAYLTSDVWTWSTGWIDVGIASLILVALQGTILGGRSGQAILRALAANGPGELSEATRRTTRSFGLWLPTLANPAIVLAIAWNMTEKPGTLSAVTAVAVAWAAGAAAARPLARVAAATEETAAAEPAG